MFVALIIGSRHSRDHALERTDKQNNHEKYQMDRKKEHDEICTESKKERDEDRVKDRENRVQAAETLNLVKSLDTKLQLLENKVRDLEENHYGAWGFPWK